MPAYRLRSFLAPISLFFLIVCLSFLPTHAVSKQAASNNEGETDSRDWSVFLPEEDAKPQVIMTCTVCHSLERVVKLRGDHDFWTDLIWSMVTNGADFTNEEVDPIAKYLSARLGPDQQRVVVPINLNTAKPEALRMLSPIASQVDKIVKAREAKKFDTPDDLLKIDGITKESFEKIKPFISVK